jgi:hypothetical protein
MKDTVTDEVRDPVLEEIRAIKRQKLADLAEIEQIEREQLAEHNHGRENPLWLDFSDLFDAALTLGQQFSTGFPTIDRFTDGGLARSTVCTIQGKPGIGKTLVATQIARALGKHCAVAALFADEGLTGARIRLGQQLGLERLRMRRPDELAKAQACRALKDQSLFWKFLQPRSTNSTVEFMAQDFDRIAPPELPRVWLIDSAQVVKSEAASKEGRRVQISDVVWRIRALADQYKAIALLVSQVNRGSYSKKNPEERVEDLAAGSETSAIEYASELILHIDGDPKTKIEIRCPKNRYTGETFSSWCLCDMPSATFHELDKTQTDADDLAAADSIRTKKITEIAKRMEAILASNPALTNRQWKEIYGPITNQLWFDARALLEKELRVFYDGKTGTTVRWYVGTQP